MDVFSHYLLFIPQFFFACFGLSIILVIILIRFKEGTCDLPKYFSNYVSTSYSKRTIVDVMFSVIEVIIIYSFFLLFSCLIAFFIYSFSAREVIEYFFNLKKNIPDEMLEWVALMITLAAILVAFKKDYYLVFSIEEVLERYKFKSKIFTIVNIMLINRLIILLKPLKVDEIYSFAFDYTYIILYIVSLVIGCYLIYRVMYLLYSKEQSELELLDKLFYKLKNRTFYFENTSNISAVGIILNGEYLFDQYVRYYSLVKKYDICKIKFESVYRECKDDVYTKIKRVIIKNCSIYLSVVYLLDIVLILIFINLIENYDYSSEIKMLFISLATWGLCIILLNIIESYKYLNSFKLLINKMFLSDNIYTYEDKEGTRYLTSTSGFSIGKINSKYFISILNLAVYFKMLLNGSTMKEVDEFYRHIENMCNENKYKEYCNDEIFHVINIYFAYLKYSVCDLNDRNELIGKFKEKSWSKFIKKRRVQGLMKAIILNTQNLVRDDGIKLWVEFTDSIRDSS